MNKESLNIAKFNLTSKLGKLSTQELTELNINCHATNSSEMDPRVAQIIKNPVFEKYLRAEKQLFRDNLATKVDLNEKAGILKFLKDIIGKKLGRIVIPIYMNQPLTSLQSEAEILDYKQTFDAACEEQSSSLRLAMTLAAFVMEFNSYDVDRRKPLDSEIGETSEVFWEDARMICERISTEPDGELFFLETERYSIQSGVAFTPSFNFKSIKLEPTGTILVKYNKFGDRIYIKRPNIALNNILIGKTHFHQFGTFRAENKKTGEVAEVRIKDTGFIGTTDTTVKGEVKNEAEEIIFTIEGDYKTNVKILRPEGQQIYELKVAELPKGAEDYYKMPLVSMNTSFLNQDLLKSICPTDSRLRSDRLALEYGDQDLAGDEKIRIQDFGKEKIKERKSKGEEYAPRWFKREFDGELGEDIWVYAGGYFEARKEGKWEGIPITF